MAVEDGPHFDGLDGIDGKTDVVAVEYGNATAITGGSW